MKRVPTGGEISMRYGKAQLTFSNPKMCPSGTCGGVGSILVLHHLSPTNLSVEELAMHKEVQMEKLIGGARAELTHKLRTCSV